MIDRFSPKLQLVKNNIGLLLFYIGNFNQAKSNLQQAIELNPSYIEAHSNLGFFYDFLGNKQKTIKHATKALQLIKSYKDSKRFINTKKRLLELVNKYNLS